MSRQILEATAPVSPRALSAWDSPAQHGLLIGGEWIEPEATIASLDPATGRTLGHIADASPAEVDAAVAAARAAFPGWAATVPAERGALLWRIADLLEAHIDELAELETLDQGKPLYVGRWAEIPGAIAQFRFFAGQASAIEGRTITPSITYQPAGKQLAAWTLREPVGVVAAIVPWNSPLVLTAMKLAPALAAGCTVVLKPAEDTSLTALRLAELMMEAGLPDGVLNVVTGRGARCGAALAAHRGVDKIAFTGSTPTGRAILEASKTNLKRVTLELGGKSPVLILPDADLDLAIPGAANAIFFNTGQVCVAGSRAYVHSSIYDKVLEGLVAQADAIQLGHGLNAGSQMGPLVSPAQAEKVARYVDDARGQGASVVTGGERSGPFGTFISPTIIAGVSSDMAVVREEVFGPVLALQRYDDLDAVVAEANDSDFGLAASVWTESLSHAHRLSRAIQAGTVWINCHLMFDPALPIGGMKMSGYGRDSGIAALDNYLEWKTVCAVV